MVVLYEQVSTKLDALREKRKKEHKFAYDRVFGENSTQNEVYEETTKRLIPFVLGGFNATVFAYGPTGTGKTFTMVGTPQQPGIMVMALNDLFNKMKKGSEKFQVSMSYLEIYNEHIRDLLVTNSKNLELWENPRSGIIQVTDLSQISTTSTSEVMKLLQKGNDKRRCESTAANKTSSRSHALLQINIRLSSHDSSVGEEVKTGRLFMVDLAGSERARNTQNVGMRLQEGASINKSLLALGNVINALAEGGAKFVNFRDSKLTRLLKDALTGNCKTVMIAHVSPAGEHREESRNTLIYADKAKKITTKTRQNKVDVAYHISQYQAIIGELKDEIRRLKSKLETDDKLNLSDNGESAKGGEDKEKIEALKRELIKTFNDQMELRKKLMEIENSIVAMSVEFEKQNQVIQEYENEKKSKKKGRRASEEMSEDDDDSDDEEDIEEIVEALEDLVYIQNELDRYALMKDAVNTELQEKKEKCQEIEEGLPEHASSHDQRELLALLCKVHELEIQQTEMERNGIVKEHDLYRRDLLLTRYERQRSLCDQIITKQRNLIAESRNSPNQELEELYALYQLETQYTNTIRESSSLNDLNNLRSNSVLSLRAEKLPPISKKEPEKLFKPGRRFSFSEEKRPGTPLSISSPLGSPNTRTNTPSASNISSSTFVLPPIKGASTGNDSPWAVRTGVKNNNPVQTRKKAKRMYPAKPSSVEEILVLDSPKPSKTDKERRNRERKYEPRRRGSLPGLKIPPITDDDRPSSEGALSTRRGRTRRKRNKGPSKKRGNSLSRLQDKRRAAVNKNGNKIKY